MVRAGGKNPPFGGFGEKARKGPKPGLRAD